MGRQKIQMKKIENENALQVCFSKRRTGLFKKASELNTLCGAEVAIVVFSPSGKPYSIGLPDMDTVLNRFLLCNPTEYDHHRTTALMLARHRNVIARDLNRRVMELRSLLDQQRGLRTPLEMTAGNAARGIGVDSGPDFEGLSVDRLTRLESEMKQLRRRVAMRVDDLMHGDKQLLPNGSGPSDAGPAPFAYSDPFPDPYAAGGARQAFFLNPS